MPNPSGIALAILLAAVPLGVSAQTSAALPDAAKSPSLAASTPRPSSAASSTRPYESSFDRYRPYADQPVGSWREANDTAGRIGGWKVYAREGQGGSAQTEGGGSAAPSMPAEHGGMQMSPAAGAPAPMSPAASTPGPSPVPVRVPRASTGADAAAPAASSPQSKPKTP